MLQGTGARGGLRLEAHKERSTRDPIAKAAAPSIAVLPLDQHAGYASAPIVAIDDQVAIGQPIARPAAEVSAWLHAPISGRVIAIAPQPSATQARAPAISIVIENDGRETLHSP